MGFSTHPLPQFACLGSSFSLPRWLARVGCSGPLSPELTDSFEISMWIMSMTPGMLSPYGGVWVRPPKLGSWQAKAPVLELWDHIQNTHVPGLPEQWLISQYSYSASPFQVNQLVRFQSQFYQPSCCPMEGGAFCASLFSNLYPKLAFRIVP